MKSLLLEATDELKIRNGPVPKLSENEVLITVDVAGIGGSEYLALSNPGIRRLPHAMGHGIIGHTEDGNNVAIYPLQGCGQCTYCSTNEIQLCDDWSMIGVHSYGGFQQQLAVPKSALVDLPTNMPWQKAAFIEPFANSVNAWKIAAPAANHKIAVIGAGGLGLGVVACATASRTGIVDIAEWSKTRRAAAIHLGANDAQQELSGPYDIVFDTVGSERSRNQAISLLKKGGKCIFLGFSEAIQPVNFSELIRHQKQFVGSFVYSIQQFKEAIELVHLCKKEWIKDVSFENVYKHLQDFQKGNFDVVKLVLHPNAKIG